MRDRHASEHALLSTEACDFFREDRYNNSLPRGPAAAASSCFVPEANIYGTGMTLVNAAGLRCG